MANWTHVAGIIRVDHNLCDIIGEFENNPRVLDFDKLIGKEVSFEDDISVYRDAVAHPEKYLPMGREGSLRKSVWTNPDTSGMDGYTVSIFGDLCGHNDPKEIIEWFKNKCKEILVTNWIRNATIVADNEWNGIESWSIDYDTRKEWIDDIDNEENEDSSECDLTKSIRNIPTL